MNDLLKAASPVDLARMLREAAQRYQEDAAELQAAWQDPHAGDIWIYAADVLEIAANKIEKKWNQR